MCAQHVARLTRVALFQQNCQNRQWEVLTRQNKKMLIVQTLNKKNDNNNNKQKQESKVRYEFEDFKLQFFFFLFCLYLLVYVDRRSCDLLLKGHTGQT